MENNLDQYKIAELIFLELKDELSEAERDLLNDWKSENPENMVLYNKIINENNIVDKINAYNKIDKNKAWGRLDEELVKSEKSKRTSLITILKYAGAASIVLLIGSYLFLRKPQLPEDKKPTSSTAIVSGTQKAILTTSDNEVIELGELEKRRTFHLTNVSVTDTNSTLTYQQRKEELPEKSHEIVINTLETPRGGEYSLVLSDGTRVFLNAETKIIFPEIFVSDKREVTLDGEAYFEVVASKTKPFIVKTMNYDIKVYGTSFNVSAYSSEINSHTTLVKGSVGINTNIGSEVRLTPGEQAYYNEASNSLKTRKVETQIYTSWKEGKFMFDNETLGEIMKKLERWYDVETEYLNEEIRNSHFSGTLDRYKEISDILNKVALTTHIEFNIKGNIIYVNKRKN